MLKPGKLAIIVITLSGLAACTVVPARSTYYYGPSGYTVVRPAPYYAPPVYYYGGYGHRHWH